MGTAPLPSGGPIDSTALVHRDAVGSRAAHPTRRSYLLGEVAQIEGETRQTDVDLRDRVVGSVAAGRSCRATAALFGMSVASVVKLMPALA